MFKTRILIIVHNKAHQPGKQQEQDEKKAELGKCSVWERDLYYIAKVSST